MTHQQKALIIFPTYNERDNIEKIVHAVLPLDPRIHVLIVDDNSPDGTGELADGLAERESKVNVLHRANKEGLGKAYIAGFKQALANGADIHELAERVGHKSPRMIVSTYSHLAKDVLKNEPHTLPALKPQDRKHDNDVPFEVLW